MLTKWLVYSLSWNEQYQTTRLHPFSMQQKNKNKNEQTWDDYSLKAVCTCSVPGKILVLKHYFFIIFARVLLELGNVTEKKCGYLILNVLLFLALPFHKKRRKKTVLLRTFSCLFTACLIPRSRWCVHGQRKLRAAGRPELPLLLHFRFPQSLRPTPGRLVIKILEMQTFIPFASYQCCLSHAPNVVM